MGMSLEDAITYAEKVAKIEEQACFLISNEDSDYDNHKKCGERYRQLARWLKDYKRLLEQEPIIKGYCKDCKWQKDSDGVFRRGIDAESKCPMNRIEVYEGNGYCYMFKPHESEE